MVGVVTHWKIVVIYAYAKGDVAIVKCGLHSVCGFVDILTKH